MSRQHTLKGLLAALLLITGGCSLSGSEIPADHYYRLPAPQVSKADSRLFDQVLIRPIKVEGLYNERSILYIEQDTPLQIRRYRYHYWVEPPARLVARHLKVWLRESAITGTVTTNPSNTPAALEISALITGFERLVSDSGFENQLAIEFTVTYPRGGRTGWTRQYQANVTSSTAAMHDTANGFGQALDQIMAALLVDLAGN